MNPLLNRFQNFLLMLTRGQDRVCGCTCGRHQTYHVVPYYNPHSTMDCGENYLLSTVWTQQQVDMIIGLLLGIIIICFLLWLDRASYSWLRHWRTNLKNNKGSPSYSATLRHQKDKELHQKDREDSIENNLNIKQDLSHEARQSN